jgi:hypothetical protein
MGGDQNSMGKFCRAAKYGRALKLFSLRWTIHCDG